MKAKFHTAIATALASLMFAVPSVAGATQKTSSIQYYGDAKPGKYDKKLEAAMIRKAAEKIGDLRGSVEGLNSGYIIDGAALESDQSSRLGFPVIQETIPGTGVAAGAQPLV
ncbi:hypothetical protein [Salaquimonas pukyongi]|uniref:hypothetical protein n=1 Tax=Salaquimonas pukyongi TaxID=2712698 RepID=UPI00096B6DFC|nr:hypothetical protein [Salaquimonas pukyongi]